MNKNKKIILAGFVFLFVFSFFYLAANNTRAQEKKKEKELVAGIALDPFIRNDYATEGKSNADARELFDMVSEEFNRLYGYSITLKIFPAPKFLFKALQDKTVDFAYLPLSFLCAKRLGVPVKPFIGYTSKEMENDKLCIYVRKDSGIKNVKQLQGKTFAVPWPMFLSKKDALPPKESYFNWIYLKEILLKNGINKPFKEFFKEFKALPVSHINVGYSVAFKQFDAFTASSSSIHSYKSYDKWFYDLVPVTGSCLDTSGSSLLFVYRSDVNPEIVKNIKKILLNPPQTKTIKKIEKAYKGMKLVDAEGRTFPVGEKRLKEAEKKGWLKEFDEIMKKTPLPKKKGRVK